MAQKKQKSIIVAVSGGFDPLHIGHIRLFQEAKKLGDKLVVILNNDNWLMAKKGYVFMPQKERKEILEALACVDQVIITAHPKNPTDLSVCKELAKLRPHVFANGGDRHKDNIPERATCEAIGCHMAFRIGRGGKIQSSSWLLEKHKRTAELVKQARLASRKKVIAFDLDGTLTKSKTSLDREMASLLCRLLEKKIVAVMGGGKYAQFADQLIARLKCAGDRLKNLLILPLSGGSLYRYSVGKWKQVYHHSFSSREKSKILNAFKKAFRDVHYTVPQKPYGEIIEDRGSQITFSALGQRAPLPKKEEWNKKSDIRPQLKAVLEKRLPEFQIRLGGLTSVDVTKKGIDKAYGIGQIMKMLAVSKKEIVYIGDALYKGGNDFEVKRAGTATIKIKDEQETKTLIRAILSYIK